jgi:hypothetical protein
MAYTRKRKTHFKKTRKNAFKKKHHLRKTKNGGDIYGPARGILNAALTFGSPYYAKKKKLSITIL